MRAIGRPYPLLPLANTATKEFIGPTKGRSVRKERSASPCPNAMSSTSHPMNVPKSLL